MRFLILLLALLFSFQAHAQNADAGLYNIAPKGAAYIRLINADLKLTAKTAVIKGQELAVPSFVDITPYYQIKKGDSELAWAGQMKFFPIEERHYYSAVFAQGGVTIIDDENRDDRAKAHIRFYNFSDIDLANLKTLDGKINIVGPVKQGKSDTRDINAVKLGMAIFGNNKKLADIAEENFERGENYSVLLVKDATGKYQGKFAKAATRKP